MQPGLWTSPRAAIMATFSAFGAVVGTFSGATPQLLAQNGLDETNYGIGVTVMTAATVAAMGLAGTLARHASHRTILLVSLPSFLVVLGLLLHGGSPLAFMAIAVLFGLMSGVTDVIMNAEAGAIEIALKKRVYTTFHAMVSFFIALFAILSSLLSTRYGTGVATLAATLPVLVAMAMVHRAIPGGRLPQAASEPASGVAAAFTPRLILIGVAAGLVISCEVTALFWSSSLLASVAPSLAAIAGLGAAFFGFSNALVRFIGDGLRSRYDETLLMSVLIGVGITGFIGLGLTDGFIANLVFFALVGFGTAILCPCLFSLASVETPANRAAGLSVSMLVAGIPRIIMPSVIGVVTDQLSIRVAFIICAASLLVALLVIRKIGRHQRQLA